MKAVTSRINPIAERKRKFPSKMKNKLNNASAMIMRITLSADPTFVFMANVLI